MADADVAFEHRTVRGAGVDLHVVRTGDGPAVVLLHGFPEHWTCWLPLMSPLARAGYSVWAPDLRGINLSEHPPDVAQYRLDLVLADVAALVAATGQPAAHIVGHDWGGLVAWFFAAHHPQLTRSLTILNAPHPTLYRRVLWRSRQCLRSAYVPFFMTPWVPERVLLAFNGFVLRQMFLRSTGRAGVFSTAELDRNVAAAARPGSLTGGLNYYRANARLGFTPPAMPRIEAPTLVLWGTEDPALGVNLLDGLDTVVARPRVVRLPDVGHWPQHEAPNTVLAHMLDFWPPATATPAAPPALG